MSYHYVEWVSSGYTDDILENFRQKELKLPEYLGQSPQLFMRRYLVDWIALIAEKRNICNTALHLSIYFLDHFMDNHDIDEPRVQLAALGAFSIACKFEERDNNVPRLGELNKFVNESFSLQEFMQIESMLLKYFNWELYVPTTAHFAECFSDVAISESDFLMGHPVGSFDEVHDHVERYIKYFLDLSLQDSVPQHSNTDHAFLKFRPSLVAAACFASTRICLNFTPNWSVSLQEKTRYAFDELWPCIEIMMRHGGTAHEADQTAARSSLKRKSEDENGGDSDSKRVESLNTFHDSSPESDTCSR